MEKLLFSTTWTKCIVNFLLIKLICAHFFHSCHQSTYYSWKRPPSKFDRHFKLPSYYNLYLQLNTAYTTYSFVTFFFTVFLIRETSSLREVSINIFYIWKFVLLPSFTLLIKSFEIPITISGWRSEQFCSVVCVWNSCYCQSSRGSLRRKRSY